MHGAGSLNYFGHACVTSQLEDDPRIVYGSMLPDFCGMAKAGPCKSADPKTSQGVSLHYEVDRHFHSAPLFLQYMARGAAELRQEGLSKGAARAIAHVGVELLLDGIYMETSAFCDPYLRALEVSQSVLATLNKPAGDRFSQLAKVASAVVQGGVPNRLRDERRVADLLFQILQRRPRIAFSRDKLPAVTTWLTAAKTDLRHDADALFKQMVDAVAP